MDVMEPYRPHSLASRSMGQSFDVMRIPVMLKPPTEAVMPFESTDSPSATSSSKTDFDPNFVGDNSEAVTDGSSRVRRDAPGWRGSTITLLREFKKFLLAKLRTERGINSSNSELSEVGTLDSSDSPSTASVSEADFVACQEISEEATNESPRIKRDARGWKGSSRSLPSGSKKFLAKFRADGGTESPNSDNVSEEGSREEFVSKTEKDSTHAHGGGVNGNYRPTPVQDDEFPIGRDKLEGQQQLDGHKLGFNRSIKGWISIQKSVKKLQKSKPHEYRRKVVVNAVPIKDIDVKKAEELAGPIHPGNYWYDIQAGFWGIDPGPCLGVIPPCILELNLPMSRSCSGGNTGILVNGRELHEKDLERLSFRGLPTTPGMAYCISIDGRVMDESLRKYITSLGMLAPSLGKNGRGAGIYMPAVY